MKQQMNKILVENYLNHTLPVRMGYKIEKDLEEISMGNVELRSKTREEYIQRELEEEINKVIRCY